MCRFWQVNWARTRLTFTNRLTCIRTMQAITPSWRCPITVTQGGFPNLFYELKIIVKRSFSSSFFLDFFPRFLRLFLVDFVFLCVWDKFFDQISIVFGEIDWEKCPELLDTFYYTTTEIKTKPPPLKVWKFQNPPGFYFLLNLRSAKFSGFLFFAKFSPALRAGFSFFLSNYPFPP